MPRRCTPRFLAIAVLFGLMAWAVSLAMAQAATLPIELNKLEQRDNNACRAYLVFQNKLGEAISALRLDLILFRTDGIIETRLALDAGRMPVEKTVVKLFDIPGLNCDDIGQMLLNSVLQCETSAGARDDCISLVEVSSRAKASLRK